MKKMTHAMRTELADAIRGRYTAAAHRDKRRNLKEFIAATGYHEKSAIRVLNAPPEPKRRQTRKRPSIYDDGRSGCPDCAVGGFRSRLRQAAEGTVAHSVVRAGAKWTLEASD